MIDEVTARLLGVTVKAGDRQEVDGVFYRRRRGQVVIIPAEWVRNVTTKQTQRARKHKKGKLDASYLKAKYKHIPESE